MFSWWILGVISLTVANPGAAQSEYGTATTCEDFERGASFHPHDIVDSMWKIIYFWSETTETRPIMFSLVDKKKLKRFKNVIDAIEPHLGAEWKMAALMMEPRPGVQVLFTYMGTPGAYRAFIKIEQRDKARPHPPPLLKLADIRFKLEGRFMAMMCCEDLTAFVLTRVDEVPRTEEECVAIASILGLRGPKGRSHLYLKNLTRTDL